MSVTGRIVGEGIKLNDQRIYRGLDVLQEKLKTNLSKKGVDSDDKNIEELVDSVLDIPTGSKEIEYSEIALPTILQTSTLYTFLMKNGDVLVGMSNGGSTAVYNSGVWLLDHETKQLRQIWTEGDSWVGVIQPTFSQSGCYEDDDGNVLISNGNGNIKNPDGSWGPGALVWDGTVCQKVLDSGYGTNYWFRGPAGEIFVTTASSGTPGILQWDSQAKKLKQVLDLTAPGILNGANYAFNFTGYFITSAGDMFVASTSSFSTNSGIFKLDKATGIFKQVHSAGYNFVSWCEIDGKVFVSSENVAGILRWDAATQKFVSAYSTMTAWNVWFKASDGTLFVGGSGGTNAGILKLTKGASSFTTAYSTLNYWKYFFEDSKGVVWATGTGTNGGILRFNGSTFTQVYSTSTWSNFLEGPRGEIFFNGGSSSALGILKYNEDTKLCEVIYDKNYYWVFSYVAKNGDVFFSNSNADNTGIVRWDGATATQVHTKGYYWRYWYEDTLGNIFVTSYMTSNGILRWDSNTKTFVTTYATKGSWNDWRETDGVLRTSSASFCQLLEYNRQLQKFFTVGDYGNVPFGSAYRLMNSTDRITVLTKDGQNKTLKNIYTVNTERGEHAVGITTERTHFLYV